MNRVCSLRALALAVVLLLSTSLAFAQSDLGSISGFVKDPSGAMIPKAKVTVKNESGLERQATTNDSGYYTITNIPPAFYKISVEVAGFKKYESPGNKLDASAALSADITLTVGAASETVEVSGVATSLQTESAAVSKDMTREQIDSLELNGRNPVFMANLVPGTRGGNLSGLSFNFSQGPSNINGARTPESLITYDGAPAVRTRSNGTSIGAADVDSTQEIQILTAGLPAGIRPFVGRTDPHPDQERRQPSSTAQLTITSATTHSTPTPGRAIIRPARTSCRTDQLQPVRLQRRRTVLHPRQVQQRPNKIFWYWGQEWVRYRYHRSSRRWTVPTALMRQGDFSELLNPTNLFYGKAMVHQGSRRRATPFRGQHHSGDQQSPNGMGILKAYPLPNINGYPQRQPELGSCGRASADISAKIPCRRTSISRTISASSSAA